MIENKPAKRFLAIGAHFDDIEIGAGGFLALEQDRGNIIKAVIVADGDYDSLKGEKIRTKHTAREEGNKSIYSSWFEYGWRKMSRISRN
jgi:LmbE family N-acetylglucosaminyl deacetylase